MRSGGRIAVVAAASLVLAMGASTARAQVTDPLVHLDRTGTAAGETMLVTGAGWPAGAQLVVEMCGNGGLRGSSDCDVPNQRSAAAGPSGTFGVELTVAKPPVPCPCVVKVTDQGSGIAATAAIAVAGVPTVPITAEDLPAARALEISSARISGGGTAAELFGAGGRRVLEVTIVNTGAVPVASPKMSVAFGRGEEPTGFVPPPDVAPMEPGETQTVTVPLDRPALTLGNQTAIVELQGIGEPVVARATTSGYPWGLLAIALLVVQLLLLRARRWLRRRTSRGGVPGDPEEGPAALPAPRLALPVGAGAAAPDVVDLRGPVTTPLDTHTEAADADPAPGPFAVMEEDLRRAIERSLALVAASTARSLELETQHEERVRAAAARQAASQDLLEQARQRADELLATATEVASAALREAEAEREAARREREEAEGVRAHSVESAWAVLEAFIREHGRNPGPATAPTVVVPAAPARLGNVEASIARAVSRAFATTTADGTLVD